MKENIGEIICQYRQNKKMTQEEFASRLGVTPQAVSKWERGNGLPDISLVKGICQILSINANILFGIADGKVVENNDILMEQEIKGNLFAEPLLLEFGEGLIPCVVAGLETDYVNQKRKDLAKATGMLMPILRLKDNLRLDKNAYQILSYDKILWEDCLPLEGEIPAQDIRIVETQPLPEIDRAFREMIDRVTSLCQEHYADIINKHIVKIMIDNIKEFFPGAVEGLVPEKISYLRVQRKMQEMLRQGESIRDILHILEALEDEGKI